MSDNEDWPLGQLNAVCDSDKKALAHPFTRRRVCLNLKAFAN